MDISVLQQSIGKYVSLSAQEYEQLIHYFTCEKLNRKQLLFREGAHIQQVAFVLSGCLRSYSVDESGMEHILQFAPEGWWITDMLSFLKGTKSHLYTESIVESEVLLLSRERQLDMFDALPKMERYFRIVTENALCATRQRVIDTLSLTARERYLQFCDTYPGIIHTIPQKYVAAYIGVTPEFLSKMRSSLYR